MYVVYTFIMNANIALLQCVVYCIRTVSGVRNKNYENDFCGFGRFRYRNRRTVTLICGKNATERRP